LLDRSSDAVVICRDVGKRFYSNESRATTMRELFIRLLGRRPVRHSPGGFAIRDLSFEVKRGETVALIGDNGSGKSTVLRLLAGIYRPTSGSIRTIGRVAPVIGLGAGLHQDLNGLENAWLYASVLGLSDEEIEQRLPDIIDFADLGEFLTVPVKYYSSGMLTRLAFSVAMSVRPDVFLVDEALAVGDQSFRQRCIDLLAQYIEDGLTLVVVSHDLALLRRFANRAIWLEEGRIRMQDDADSVIESYEQALKR
jgi:ABC-type polysaccharide/polyol phosphate transport system ATPase subunit